MFKFLPAIFLVFLQISTLYCQDTSDEVADHSLIYVADAPSCIGNACEFECEDFWLQDPQDPAWAELCQDCVKMHCPVCLPNCDDPTNCTKCTREKSTGRAQEGILSGTPEPLATGPTTDVTTSTSASIATIASEPSTNSTESIETTQSPEHTSSSSISPVTTSDEVADHSYIYVADISCLGNACEFECEDFWLQDPQDPRSAELCQDCVKMHCPVCLPDCDDPTNCTKCTREKSTGRAQEGILSGTPEPLATGTTTDVTTSTSASIATMASEPSTNSTESIVTTQSPEPTSSSSISPVTTSETASTGGRQITTSRINKFNFQLVDILRDTAST